MAVYEHDVLVIGAGLAGMRAAISAQQQGADVAMISKVHPVRSHSNAAQGGINGPGLGEGGGPWEEHAFETTKASDYLGDQDAIEVLSKEGGQEVLQCEHWGVVFSRKPDGSATTLTWTSKPTRFYQPQKRARFAEADSWLDIAPEDLVPDPGATTSRTFPDTAASQHFYRVKAVRPLAP
jgi:succinate dehydrogenase/fumarate reductase flavoprotein subunit